MSNKNIKSSFKRSENIQKKEAGPDSTVSNNQISSVTLNELAMNARDRGHTIISNFREAVNPKTDINPKEVKLAQIYSELYESSLNIFQYCSADV